MAREITPETAKVRHWIAEIERQEKVYKKWLTEAKEIMNIYRGDEEVDFNILASNTDTIRPALYNSTPQPDIRRRFRDADPLGKLASEILERTISYENDCENFDGVMFACVSDALLPGRGQAYVEYEPKTEVEYEEKEVPVLDEMGQPVMITIEDPETGQPMEMPQTEVKMVPVQMTDDDGEPLFDGEGDDKQPIYAEIVVSESAPVKHVQYCDFIVGPGEEWHEVEWVAYKFNFTKKEAIEKFGAHVAKEMVFDQKESTEGIKDPESRQAARTCPVYQIWDKAHREIIFISKKYTQAPLLEVEDTLKLEGFFNCPEPLYMAKDQTSLIPIPPYRRYKKQAEELDKVVRRRNALISSLKIRGAYRGELKDVVENILAASDNEFVAITNPTGIEAAGGIGAAIWIMPFDQVIKAIQQLYESEQMIQNNIQQLSGLADIMRGATQAQETATAQRIKSQWGSLRIQDAQREVQRFARDLIRIKAEIIAEHYSPETLAAITGIEAPPEIFNQAVQLLKDQRLRDYKIDIETDSTIQETVERDMAGLAELLNSMGQVLQAVQLGVPPHVVQETIVQIIRRARLGKSLEDVWSNALQGQQGQPGQPGQAPQGLPQQQGSTPEQILNASKQVAAQDDQRKQELQMALAQAQEAAAQAQNMQAGNAQAAEMLRELIKHVSGMVNTTMKAALNAPTQMADEQTRAFAEQDIKLRAILDGLAKLVEVQSAPKKIEIVRDANGDIKSAKATVESSNVVDFPRR